MGKNAAHSLRGTAYLFTSVALRALARALFGGFSRGGVDAARPAPFAESAAGGTLDFLLVVFHELLELLAAGGALVL